MLTGQLKPFQEPGVDRFLERGSLLIAWEMGMGKTVAGIACAEELLGCGDIDTCIVICQASLMYQWAQAIAKFTDVVKRTVTVKGKKGKRSDLVIPVASECAIIDGKPYQKDRVKYTAADDRKRQFHQAFEDHPDYVIMSYDTLLSDSRLVRRLKASMVILDEASAIKTFAAQRTKKVKLLLQVEYRLALTGTPMENRPDEAFSIMEWIDDTILGAYDLFEHTYIKRDRYGNVDEYKNLPLFHRLMEQAMDRKNRLDPDVAPYLPECDTGEWEVELLPETEIPYQTMAGDLLDALSKVKGNGAWDMHAYYAGDSSGMENTALGRVMARQGAINMLLDHPDLVINSGMDYQDSARARNAGETRKHWPGSKYCYDVWQSGLLDNASGSAKLDELISKVDLILDENPANKIIVFSRYPMMLDLIEDRLFKWGCVQYHGMMSTAEKAAAVERFGKVKMIRVFLSSDAGAYGNDLGMANYLVNYDLPWSSGRADQRNGRHQRASSEFEMVYVRNLITVDTLEERDLARLAWKRSVAAAIVDGKMSGYSGRIENDVASLTSYLTGSA